MEMYTERGNKSQRLERYNCHQKVKDSSQHTDRRKSLSTTLASPTVYSVLINKATAAFRNTHFLPVVTIVVTIPIVSPSSAIQDSNYCWYLIHTDQFSNTEVNG